MQAVAVHVLVLLAHVVLLAHAAVFDKGTSTDVVGEELEYGGHVYAVIGPQPADGTNMGGGIVGTTLEHYVDELQAGTTRSTYLWLPDDAAELTAVWTWFRSHHPNARGAWMPLKDVAGNDAFVFAYQTPRAGETAWGRSYSKHKVTDAFLPPETWQPHYMNPMYPLLDEDCVELVDDGQMNYWRLSDRGCTASDLFIIAEQEIARCTESDCAALGLVLRADRDASFACADAACKQEAECCAAAAATAGPPPAAGHGVCPAVCPAGSVRRASADRPCEFATCDLASECCQVRDTCPAVSICVSGAAQVADRVGLPCTTTQCTPAECCEEREAGAGTGPGRQRRLVVLVVAALCVSLVVMGAMLVANMLRRRRTGGNRVAELSLIADDAAAASPAAAAAAAGPHTAAWASPTPSRRTSASARALSLIKRSRDVGTYLKARRASESQKAARLEKMRREYDDEDRLVDQELALNERRINRHSSDSDEDSLDGEGV